MLHCAPAADWLWIFLTEGNPFQLKIQTQPRALFRFDVRTGGGKGWSGHGGEDDVTLNGFAVGRKRLSLYSGWLHWEQKHAMAARAQKPTVTHHDGNPLANATQDPARGQSWMDSPMLRLVPGNGGQVQVARCKSRKA